MFCRPMDAYKEFWYIIVCYIYVDSMFVSGGGGGVCQPVVGGGAFLVFSFPECLSEWGLFVN